MAATENDTLNIGSGRVRRALDFACPKAAWTGIQRGPRPAHEANHG
jgi:hypothetical protein